jgi:hypothetical protein
MITKADEELGERMLDKYEADMRRARAKIARMTPEERTELEDAARSLGVKMQSGFDPTFKNVTPPPEPLPKHRSVAKTRAPVRTEAASANTRR